MPTLVVFDCFGTIVDSGRRPHLPDTEAIAAVLPLARPLALKAAAEIRDRLGGSLLSASGRQIPTVEAFARACASRGVALRSAQAEAVAARAFADVPWGSAPVPGALALLAELRRAGHTLRVLSNCFAPAPTMDAMLANLGLLPFFEARSWSSRIGWRKPAREAFAAAGEGAFDRRVMVGDSPALDLEPARALGWDVVQAFRDGAHGAEVVRATARRPAREEGPR